MDNNTIAAEVYEFLDDNDALGHLADLPVADGIAEIEEYLSDLHNVKETIKDIENIAGAYDDHEYCLEGIKPLMDGLRTIKEQLEARQDKRMVADTGYEVKHAVQIGNKEILFAENMEDPDGHFYMKAEYTENGIIGQYDLMIRSNSYLAAMGEFTSSIDRQILSLREEIGKTDFDPHPITADKCYPHDYGQDLRGKVVAIKAEVLRPELRRADRQLVLVDGGFGAVGNARGSAVFCYHLNDGQHTRFERHEVLGEIRVLPEWAAERLDIIKAEQEAARMKSAPAEKVAGYTITERVQVGKKLFVLGENPDAVSPYVTWQRLEGRTGFDWGHYFPDREKALADLNNRADKERDSTSPDKAKRNRNDAR